MVLYVASDLLWASRIKSTGEAAGVPCRPVRNLEMLEARLGDSPVRALVVDLEAGETGLSMITRLRAPSASDRARAVRIVAFGPHVDVGAMQAAKAAGADTVMTRGAFNSRLVEVLRELDQEVHN